MKIEVDLSGLSACPLLGDGDTCNVPNGPCGCVRWIADALDHCPLRQGPVVFEAKKQEGGEK